MSNPQYLNWLNKYSSSIQTQNSHEITVFEFNHCKDDLILSEWAKVFRNNYCEDAKLPALVSGTGLSTAEFLTQHIFPSRTDGLGPATRAGDFSELLVADYLQFRLNYWVPRLRYQGRYNRNNSTQGCDTIGFLFDSNGKNDTLAIYESKAKYSESKSASLLQNAIDDSNKDPIRLGDTLAALKLRYLDKEDTESAQKIERFQNYTDTPYKEIFGAVAHFTTTAYNENLEKTATTVNHVKKAHLQLIIIKGTDMMPLIHSLYERAAHEA